MIGYTMVGTNNLEQAIRFYEPLMAEMGRDQRYRDDLSISWGRKGDDTFAFFFVGYPFDGGPATVGNGVMTAFRFDDNAALVDRLYVLAMENGGSDEGAPGFRPHYGEGFYGCLCPRSRRQQTRICLLRRHASYAGIAGKKRQNEKRQPQAAVLFFECRISAPGCCGTARDRRDRDFP